MTTVTLRRSLRNQLTRLTFPAKRGIGCGERRRILWTQRPLWLAVGALYGVVRLNLCGPGPVERDNHLVDSLEE